MQAAQKLFIIAWSAVVIVFIGLMAMLYASLIPHFAEIGDWAVWLVRLGMVCAGCFAVAFTWFKIVSMHHNSKFVQRGDVVSYLGNKQPVVVSATHEQAKIPQYVMAKEEKLDPNEQDIIEVYNDGVSTLEGIADSFQMKYHRVQAIIANAKKQGKIHRK